MLAVAKGGGLRVARDHATGDLYVWDAADATHRQMIEHRFAQIARRRIKRAAR